MTTNDSLERFLKVQLQAWGRQNEAPHIIRAEPVIAITREPGCNGESIAQTLAEKFGLVLYDWRIVEEIARNTHMSEQVIATLDEKVRSKLNDWLADFPGGSGLSSDQYIRCLRSVLFAIATHGNAVILGRLANFLLPPEKKTLGLCLVAPLEVRVKNMMQKLNLSQDEARKHIDHTEQEHRLWVRKFGHADITDAAHYHMVINTAWVRPEIITQIVKAILMVKS